MNLTINYVWIGANQLGWLDLFMIDSWSRWGCKVKLFTLNPITPKLKKPPAHTHASLGLSTNCKIYDLRTLITQGDSMPKTREVLAHWFSMQMGVVADANRKFTFNMVDLCKSFIAATRKGIVMDLKIGPSPHIKKYVDAGVFEKEFIGCKRAGTLENQVMGSMEGKETEGGPESAGPKRIAYGKGFEAALFKKPTALADMKRDNTAEWFAMATAAHKGGMASSTWFDIGTPGRAKHESEYGISDAEFDGIAGEKCYGPIRIFKREDDQTNKAGGTRTSDSDRQALHAIALAELEALS